MAADPSIRALQVTINRFASAGGFASVATDGIWGSKTKAGVTAALAWISKNTAIERPLRDAAIKYTVERQYDSPGVTLSLIAFFLGNVANQLNLGAGSAVATGGGSGPSVQITPITPPGGGAATTAAGGGGQITPPSAGGAAAAGLFGMPRWLTYVGGGGLALVVLMLAAKRKKPGAQVAGQDIRCVRRQHGKCVEWSWR
jgi:hypothetical protein